MPVYSFMPGFQRLAADPCRQVWRLFQLTRDPALLLPAAGPLATAARVLVAVAVAELAAHLAQLPWMAQEVRENGWVGGEREWMGRR